jgi:hypothetical protein
MQAKRHFRKWLIQAPLGLVLVGAGFSITIEGGLMRYDHAPFLEWFIVGTFGLIVFNSGLSVFGNAILHRVRYERARKAEEA